MHAPKRCKPTPTRTRESAVRLGRDRLGRLEPTRTCEAAADSDAVVCATPTLKTRRRPKKRLSGGDSEWVWGRDRAWENGWDRGRRIRGSKRPAYATSKRQRWRLVLGVKVVEPASPGWAPPAGGSCGRLPLAGRVGPPVLIRVGQPRGGPPPLRSESESRARGVAGADVGPLGPTWDRGGRRGTAGADVGPRRKTGY
jgi:hypothetical protein